MNELSGDEYDALRCARASDGQLIYVFCGYMSVSGGKVFRVKNIKNLLEKGFMSIAGVFSVRITEKGEIFLNGIGKDVCDR